MTDDYTLAAFLSGELPAERRPSVAAALVADPEAREILHMAAEALAEAMRFERTRTDLVVRATRPAVRPGGRREDRRPRARPSA